MREAQAPAAIMDSPAHMSLLPMDVPEPVAMPGEPLAADCEYQTPHAALLRGPRRRSDAVAAAEPGTRDSP